MPAPAPMPAEDLSAEIPTDMEQPQEAPSDDKPFDEPFDAEIEANEEEDPEKYIEQLSGKLGQSLRKYTETQGKPDFELEKFAINSVVSATHTAQMDEEDRDDIIKKVNTAGKDDSEDSDNDVDNDNTDNGNDSNDGGDIDDMSSSNPEDEEGLEEIRIFEEDNIFLEKPKKNNMFQKGSNDILNNNIIPIKEAYKTFINSKKNGIFDKKILKIKLQETFNQDIMSEPFIEPIVKPTTKPSTEPVKPLRRNKPFIIEPDTIPQPRPKAIN